MSEFYNKYYFSIHDLVSVCRIGGVDCLPKFRMDSYGNKRALETRRLDNGLDEVLEVPGGHWISRHMADNSKGSNYRCHTLVSNSTVTFSKKGLLIDCFVLFCFVGP